MRHLHSTLFALSLAQPLQTRTDHSGPPTLRIAPGELYLRRHTPSRALCRPLLIRRCISQNAMEIRPASLTHRREPTPLRLNLRKNIGTPRVLAFSTSRLMESRCFRHSTFSLLPEAST